MILFLSDFITLYASTVPFAVFFHCFNDAEDRLKNTLLRFIPLTFLFYFIYRGTLLIPNELAGMVIKSVCARLIFVLYYHRVLNLGYLQAFLQSYVVSLISVFIELLLSGFVDVSWFSNYLSQEGDLFFLTAISLFSSLLNTGAVYLLAKHLRRYYRVRNMPKRYLLIALVSLLVVIAQGALLFYFNHSSDAIPLPLMIVFLIAAGAAALLPLTIVSNEARIKRVLFLLPEFVSVQDHLNRQLDYLGKQTEDLKNAAKSLKQYKEAGDFSVSVNDVFHAREEFIDRLYTDNPAVNTLLMYYADRFEKENIRYSFDMRCSTYTGFSDYFLIYLLSGLFDTSKKYAELTMDKNANIYTIRFRTDTPEAALRSFLRSVSHLASEVQCPAEFHEDTLLLTLTAK